MNDPGWKGDTYTCRTCGFSLRLKKNHCDTSKPLMHRCERRRKGVGDWTHWLIRRVTFETYTSNCRCRSMVYKMNAWGWHSVFHFREITAGMVEEARKRGWRLARFTIIAWPGCASLVFAAIVMSLVGRCATNRSSRPACPS
jgi:hypothetical protein